MSLAIRSVVVFGDGIAAATAALALARAYRRLDVEVSLVGRGSLPSAHAAHAAAPDIAALHRLLGIAEDRLLRETPATFHGGQLFVGWSGEGSNFLHAYGEAGRAFAGLSFLQHWVRARNGGLRVPLEDFCLAAAAARHGRVPADRPAEPEVHHGYQLDARSYQALLMRRCGEEGVAIIRDDAATAEVAAGRIEALRLAAGERITADLFVDTDGMLIDSLDPEGACPAQPVCDRLLLASGPAIEPVPLYARIAAHRAGHVQLLPLRDRTAVALAYASRWMTDAEALAALPSLAGMPILGCDPPVAQPDHRRKRLWVGNCVAIGDAAGAEPALEAGALLGLQLAVAQLVLLFPVDPAEMAEAAIYDSEIGGQLARIADFHAMHFRLNRRPGEPFWDAVRVAPVSAELQAKIALFRARGMFAHYDHEPYVDESWALCMAGHGLVPEGYDPQVDKVEEGEAIAAFQGQLRDIARKVGSMHSHAAALAQAMASGR